MNSSQTVRFSITPLAVQAFAACCILFLGIAYLSHLGYIPLRYDDDEGRRALVTSEMMLSGDYVTPTINGEIYLNKPPLYNWIVSGYFKAFGNYSMFAFRLQVFVAILLTGYIVYRFTSRHLSKQVAFFTAFAYMTNGRILIFDSFTGLIDTSFALIVYLQFMLIYEFGEKKKFWQLFLLTYLLTAIGFMLKGMPALVFDGLSLLTYFIWKKKFLSLFHVAHFCGVAVLLLLTGSYYYFFFSRNDISPANVFGNLLNESSRRTPAHFGLARNVLHLFTFPLEMLYHYAPWTIFVITLFQKNFWQRIRQNNFVYYSALIFLVNFPVYWISPEVYPRYLFMFLPLIFSIFFYLYFETLDVSSWQHRFVRGFILFICIIVTLTFIILPFTSFLLPGKGFQSFLLAIPSIIIFLIAWKKPSLQLFAFILLLLIMRMGFNVFVLERRALKYEVVKQRADTIINITRGNALYLLKGSEIGNFDGLSFYIGTGRNQVLKWSDISDSTAFYIADREQLKEKSYTRYFQFPNFYAKDSLSLVRFKQD